MKWITWPVGLIVMVAYWLFVLVLFPPWSSW